MDERPAAAAQLHPEIVHHGAERGGPFRHTPRVEQIIVRGQPVAGRDVFSAFPTDGFAAGLAVDRKQAAAVLPGEQLGDGLPIGIDIENAVHLSGEADRENPVGVADDVQNLPDFL